MMLCVCECIFLMLLFVLPMAFYVFFVCDLIICKKAILIQQPAKQQCVQKEISQEHIYDSSDTHFPRPVRLPNGSPPPQT